MRSFLDVPHINLLLDLYHLQFLEPFHRYALLFLSLLLSFSSFLFLFYLKTKTYIAFIVCVL